MFYVDRILDRFTNFSRIIINENIWSKFVGLGGLIKVVKPTIIIIIIIM